MTAHLRQLSGSTVGNKIKPLLPNYTIPDPAVVSGDAIRLPLIQDYTGTRAGFKSYEVFLSSRFLI